MTMGRWGAGILFGLVVLGAANSGMAAERETLRVCAPCSRSFLPAAEDVVRELALEEQVAVIPSSCLGPCAQGNVLSFRDEVYSQMDAEKLKNLLRWAFPTP